MYSTSIIVLAFALAVTVYAHPFRKCGLKDVVPYTTINYPEFVSQSWKIVYVPDHPDFANVKSAGIAKSKAIQRGCAYRSLITYTYNDNKNTPVNIEVQYVGNGAVFEDVLDAKYKFTGESNIVTFYGYKQDRYAQYHICTYSYSGTPASPNEIDFRFVIVKTGYTLTAQDVQDIAANDKNQNFRGKMKVLGSTK